MTTNNENKYKELLQVGQVFKNYKALCEHLGEEVKRNNSKEAQVKNWRRYFSFVKEGHKIIITEIYQSPQAKKDNRKGGNNKVSYIDIIEKLLLDLLVQAEDGKVFYSKNILLKSLRVVNSNYTYGKRYPNRASKELDVAREQLDDFYNISDSLLERNVEKAISSLENQSLITCKMVKTVGVVATSIDTNQSDQITGIKKDVLDDYGDTEIEFQFSETKHTREHRKATDEEIDLIRDIERETLLALGVKSKQQVFTSGQNYKFYKMVTDRLFQERSIYVYYNSYEISFNPQYIFEEWEKQEMLLDLNSRTNTQKDLNARIVERLELNTINRKRKAVGLYADTGKHIYKMRMSFDYLENHSKLVDNFIRIEEGLKNK